MKMVVRAFAILLLVATVLVWAGLGPNMGWTKTSVAITKIDPVTEIEFFEYKDQFVPGIEFLALGVLGSVIIFAVTLFVPITPKKR